MPLPSALKIPVGATGILNIAAKIKNSYQMKQDSISTEEKKKTAGKAERYNHLLIAKVKDTQIMFGFIVEASLVESTGPNVS